MTKDLHPFPGDWHWWASYDGGETITVGPAASRDEIIQMVEDDRLGEYEAEDGTWRTMADISECRENNQDLARWFDVDQFLEDAGDGMDDDECGADESGDRHPLDEISKEQKTDLAKSVHAAIRHWQTRHGLKLRSYWFAESRNHESIDVPHPERTAKAG